MRLHLLNGDALAAKFPAGDLPGEVIICRECLIEGPLDGDCPTAFWRTRARYLRDTHGESPARYLEEVAKPLNRLAALPAGAEVNLWFEHDLFCQANLWLVLSLLRENPDELNTAIVYPAGVADLWRGFGPLDKEGLLRSYAGRTAVTGDDLSLGANLWEAYKNHDLDRLDELSQVKTPAFPHLAEVCRAHRERFDVPGRPERVLAEIIAAGAEDFTGAFAAFSRREGVYGFGDVQVRRLYERHRGTSE